jgi:hypothetical protein
MTVSIDIPQQAERLLREAFGDNLGRAALEAIAIEGYRGGKLTAFEVQTLLGFEDRWETQAWFASRKVNLNYSLEDLDADRATLNRTLGPAKS